MPELASPSEIRATHQGLECLHELSRDRWGRPHIDGDTYERASKISNVLDEGVMLEKWKLRQVAIGVSLPQSEDLREAVLASRFEDNATPVNNAVRSAMERAGANSAATRGTTLHTLLSRVNRGLALPPDLTPAQRASIDAYRRLVFDKLHLEPLGAEVFVANKEWLTAGTLDAAFRHLDGSVLVGDIKSGAKSWERKFSLPVAMQMAVYANGRRWCPVAGWMEQVITRQDSGLLISVPVDTGTCAVDLVNLAVGARGVELALEVLKFRKLTAVERQLG